MKPGIVQAHPEWRLIVERLADEDYGVVIAHGTLATLTGLTSQSRRYFSQVQRARRVLLAEWQRELESMPGIGYRLVEPPEFTGRSRRQLRLSQRRVKRAGAILVAAPQHLLTDAENAANANMLAKVGALEAFGQRTLRDTRPSVLATTRVDVPKLLKH